MSSSPHYKGDTRDAIQVKGDKITVQPGGLNIIWGADPRYWRLPTKTSETAELLQVCWLEVSGSVGLDRLVKGKEYVVSFSVSLKPDAFGWTDSSVHLMAQPGKASKYIWKNADVSKNKPGDICDVPRKPVLKFTVPAEISSDDKLLFGIYEIWKGRWKGGLVIHQVVIEPFNTSVHA